MSIFKTKWIILKIDKSWKNDFLYTIFSYDYWKIKASKILSKREKILDLWYILSFEVETKKDKNIHKIKNIKILSQFSYENKGFHEINDFLSILAYVLKNTPEWLPIYEIYNIFDVVNKKNLNAEKLLLVKLKIKNILWLLDIKSQDETIWRILKFIDKNHINEILKLSWISEERFEKLRERF